MAPITRLAFYVTLLASLSIASTEAGKSKRNDIEEERIEPIDPEVGLRLFCKASRKGGVLKKLRKRVCHGYMPPPKEVPPELSAKVELLMYGVTAIVAIAAATLLRFVPATRGRGLHGIISHVVFVICFVLIWIFAPDEYQDTIFSHAGVAVVGVLFPVLESVRAVCTEGEADDARWIQYWLGMGTMMIMTENLEYLATHVNRTLADVFFHLNFAILLWLQLPFTDGATLLWDEVTKPYLVPALKPLTGKIIGTSFLQQLSVWTINGSHLYTLYFVFILMPGFVERFICVMVGTLYPLIASLASLTMDDPEETTKWLLYWSAFAMFHMVMDISEDVLAWMPGFYSVMLCVTVWLLLPMTNGAEQVFRRVLAPAFGLRSAMIKRDARILIAEATSKLSVREQTATLAAISGEIDKYAKPATKAD